MEQQTTFIPDGMNAFERNVKRIGDCIIAGILLIIFSPLFLICYIAVKREDGGPAIFKQERIGRFGRPFIFISSAVCVWMRKKWVLRYIGVGKIND